MSAVFTPGPWAIQERVGGNRHLMIRAGFGNICHVNASINKDANANLIAAAPELFEAGEDAAKELESLLGRVAGGDIPLRNLRAALAKARGQ